MNGDPRRITLVTAVTDQTAVERAINCVAYDPTYDDIPGVPRRSPEAPVASLATIGADGLPQVTAVWFLHDDGALKLSLNSSRLKTRNLQARSQCSLFILDLANPYRYLEVRGHARVEPDDDYAFARKLGAKYNADLSERDRPGERRLVVTIEPANVYAVDMRAG